MRIKGREIGAAWPPYVIAEIGVNHDGSVERALELVDAAAAAGADAIKTQYFRAEALMSKASQLAAYQQAAGATNPIDLLAKLEMPLDALSQINARARTKGLHAIVTVFSEALVDDAESLDVDAYKVASPDIIHRPLLRRLQATGRPMIVSTGASTDDEITRAAEWLDTARQCDRLAVLHCISAYPAPIDTATLSGVHTLADLVPGAPVGYSDHTEGTIAGQLAVAAGAMILEKHLTYDRTAAGPDHAASIEPDELAAYIRRARRAWMMMGEGKRVCKTEHDVRSVSRQSVVTIRDLAAGHTITSGDLTVKRPGSGIGPWLLDDLIGQQIARPVPADTPIVPDDVAGWAARTDGVVSAA